MKNGECDKRIYPEITKLDLRRSRNDAIKAWELGSLRKKKKRKNHPQTNVQGSLEINVKKMRKRL